MRTINQVATSLPAGALYVTLLNFITMATGNPWLGTLRGSVGDITLSRRNSKQVVRVRRRQIKNPQTDAQMIQRCIANSVSQAYSQFKGIADHSIQGLTQGSLNQSQFLSVNMRMLRQKLTGMGTDWAGERCYLPVGFKGLAPNPYVISRGSYNGMTEKNIGVSSSEITWNVAANTYQAVIDAFGLQRGDQLTFVVMLGDLAEVNGGVEDGGVGHMENVYADYFRIVLDPRNSNGTEAPLSSSFISNGKIGFSHPDNIVPLTYIFGAAEATDTVMMNIVNDDYGFIGATVITTHNENEVYSYTNSRMKVISGVTAGRLDRALMASRKGDIDVENPLYLKKAEKN